MITRQDTKKIIRIGVYIILISLIVGYAIFATHNFILGPKITIIEPSNGATIATSSVQIVGIVKRVQSVSLNERPLNTDENGNFKEVMTLAPGYNVFSIVAEDRFVRKKEYRLQLIYKLD